MAKKSDKKKNDILSLIEDHHDMLRESIEVVKDEDESDDEKIKHLSRFISGLRMHSKAEEQTLYDTLIDVKDVRREFLEAQTEHSLADHLTEEIETLGFPDEWDDEIAAKGKVLVELVEHHMEEEEDQIFSDTKEHLTRDEMVSLGEDYLEKCKDLIDELEQQPLSAGSMDEIKSHVYPG